MSWWLRVALMRDEAPVLTRWDVIALVPWVVWAAYAGLVFELARRWPLPRPVHVGRHILAAVALQTPIELFWWTWSMPVDTFPAVDELLFRYGAGMLTYAVLLSAGLMRDHYIAEYERAGVMLRLQRELADAELQALRLQVDPRLLSAVLEEIERTCTSDPARAERLMVLLGDFLRATLAQSVGGEVRLAGELARLRPMLKLLAAERERRIDLDVHIDDDHLRALAASPALVSTIYDHITALPRQDDLVVRLALPAGPGGGLVLETNGSRVLKEVLEIPAQRAALTTPVGDAPAALAEMAPFFSNSSTAAKIGAVLVITYVFKLVGCVEVLADGMWSFLGWSAVATLLTVPGVAISMALARRISTKGPAVVPLTILALATLAASVVCEFAFAQVFPGYIRHFQRLGPDFWKTFVPSRGISHNHLLFSAFSFVAIAARYDQRDLDVLALRARVREAQLRKLHGQLRPHFLFNALNSVLGRLWRDPEAAKEMTATLRGFLSATLEVNPENLVPLGDEVDAVAQYLAIEQHRVGDRMTVVFAVGRDTLKAQVPALLLQPLVENAVKHAVAQVSRPVTIEIFARRRGAALIVGVRDDGPGAVGTWSDGIGLGTTRGLLRSVYGERASLHARGSRDSGFVVTMTLPGA